LGFNYLSKEISSEIIGQMSIHPV